MSRSNTRNLNIMMCIHSLKELYKLSKKFHTKYRIETFIVRFGMMKSLAKDALDYSLKVSYLDERREYAIIADILDDIYIMISRSDLRQMIAYEDIVVCKFDAMYETLGMVDERLKTIRVVSGRYQMHNITTEEKTATEKYERESQPEEYNVFPVKHLVRQYAESIQELELQEFREFKSVLDSKFKKLDILNNNNDINLSSSNALKEKCKIVCEIFDYLMKNIVYIATQTLFRKYRPTGLSFMQVVICKCPTLINQINVEYDNVRYNVTRIDPELRRDKKTTIDLIKTTQDMLCKYYREHSCEKETIDYLMSRHME